MPDEFEPGHMVILLQAPPALLRGLPAEDQAAIQSVVGCPWRSPATATVRPNLNLPTLTEMGTRFGLTHPCCATRCPNR